MEESSEGGTVNSDNFAISRVCTNCENISVKLKCLYLINYIDMPTGVSHVCQ